MASKSARGRFASGLLCVAVLAAGLTASFADHARAATLLSENFDTFPASWTVVNNSAPVGTTDWFQGNAGVVQSHQGAPDSYAAANFNNAGFGGNVSDWLITPVVPLSNGEVLAFYTRTEIGGAAFGDGLQVRLSSSGASIDVGITDSSVGDFSTVLLDINPTQYPEAWTLYSLTLSGLAPGSTPGRLAFRYLVNDTSVSGDYIGLDTFSLSDSVAQTPLPAALPLFAAALGVLGLVGRRKAAA